jgi:hypothetical protein
MAAVYLQTTRFFFGYGKSICPLNSLFQFVTDPGQSFSFSSASECLLGFLDSVGEVSLAVDHLIIFFLYSDGDLSEFPVFLITPGRIIHEIIIL